MLFEEVNVPGLELEKTVELGRSFFVQLDQKCGCLRAHLPKIRSEKDLEGVHISVGLSNFAIGAPKPMQVPLDRAFLCLAMEAGLDFALSNPEKNTVPMSKDEKLVQDLIHILEAGRVRSGETREDAGYRQLATLMELWGDEN